MSAVGTPLTRVDGRREGHGRGALHGRARAARDGRDGDRAARPIASGRVLAVDAERGAAGGRRAGRARPSQPRPHRRRRRTCCRRCSARPRRARASSRCRTTSCTTRASPWRSCVADSLERAAHAASLVRVEYEHAPPVATIEQGRDARLRARAAVRRPDARAQRARRRRRRRWPRPRCGSTPRSTWRPTTTTRWRAPATVAWWEGERAHADRLDDGRARVAADRGAPARAAARPRARPGGLRRRVVRHEGDGVAARDADGDGRARGSAGPSGCTLTRPQLFTCSGHREEQEQRIVARRDAATGG